MKDKLFRTLLVEIGDQLAELRKKKGYASYENFALDHDLLRSQYWKLEKGKANFSIKTLVKVLSIHNLTLEEFFISLNTVKETSKEPTNKHMEDSCRINDKE